MNINRLQLFAILLAAMLVSTLLLIHQDYATGQSTTGNPPGAGSISLPGLNLQGLGPGANNIAMSISIASREDSKIYFLVNKIAIYAPDVQSATVYDLNGALPGVIDTNSNSMQIDMRNLQSYLGQPSTTGIDQLYTVMRPDVNVLMIRFSTDSVTINGNRAEFALRSIDVIAPDGTAQVYQMEKPTMMLYDADSMRLYTVAFSEIYQFIDTYITRIQNNYYTSVVTNIYYPGAVIVAAPILPPVITPILIPAPFPVRYPVPFPVPFPTKRPRPTPSMTPSATSMPSVTPVASPSKMPPVTPVASIMPTYVPSGMPSKTPVFPITRPAPTAVGSAAPTLGVTSRPGGGIPPVPIPTLGVMPTARAPTAIAPIGPRLPPSANIPTAIAPGKPIVMPSAMTPPKLS